MKRSAACIMLFFSCFFVFGDGRPDIYSIVNREIFIADNWAGQSITLKQENGGYIVVRKIFGSGLPVVHTIKYRAEFKSDYQVRFSEAIDDGKSTGAERPPLYFILSVDDKGEPRLYVNGIQAVISP